MNPVELSNDIHNLEVMVGKTLPKHPVSFELPRKPFIGIAVSIKIDIEQLANWDSCKVKALMDGLAKVITASSL